MASGEVAATGASFGGVVSSPAVPELPEVETIRLSLEAALVGRRVVAVEARRIKLREGIDPRRWRQRVAGARLAALDRRGKYLVARFDTADVLFHLGMSGRLVLCQPDQPRPRHTHLVLLFDGQIELRLVDPRRFGVAVVLEPGGARRHASLAALGPDPRAVEARNALRERAAASRVAIRNLLLDQSVLAGLGNIYATEALFRAGIHPMRAANRISAARLDKLSVAIRDVLEDALAAGGTTLSDGGFVDADGEGGYFAVALAVYGRNGLPCVRCGRTIARHDGGGRSAYYCPGCQR